MGRAQTQNEANGRRGYDLAENAVARLRRADIVMSPLNFELWFRAEECADGALAAELLRLEAERTAVTEQTSFDLAARFLPDHRLAREARESGEQLALQLEVANRALSNAQTSQRTFGLNLAAGAEALNGVEDAGGVRRVVAHLVSSTMRARADADTLGRELETATAEVNRLRDHMEIIRREALTDSLTSLPNRKAFDAALAHAGASGEPVTLAMIDVDHFKTFNDTWGHATGDQVLKFVAAMIARVGHAPRLAARYGGEEFAVLFPGESPERAVADLDAMQDKIRTRLLTRRTTGEQLGSVTVSVGLAVGHGESLADLLERADEALYASKRNGRDRLTLASAPAAELPLARAG